MSMLINLSRVSVSAGRTVLSRGDLGFLQTASPRGVDDSNQPVILPDHVL